MIIKKSKKNAQNIQIVRNMRSEGWTWKEIGNYLGIHEDTAKIWLSPKAEERTRKNARKAFIDHKDDPERRKIRRDYMRNYIHQRYWDEPEFRTKYIENVKRSYNKDLGKSRLSARTRSQKYRDQKKMKKEVGQNEGKQKEKILSEA